MDVLKKFLDCTKNQRKKKRGHPLQETFIKPYYDVHISFPNTLQYSDTVRQLAYTDYMRILLCSITVLILRMNDMWKVNVKTASHVT